MSDQSKPNQMDVIARMVAAGHPGVALAPLGNIAGWASDAGGRFGADGH